jgi:hypothetical protein
MVGSGVGAGVEALRRMNACVALLAMFTRYTKNEYPSTLLNVE